MNRYRLATTVRVEGHNVLGVYSTIVLTPLTRGRGWIWNIGRGLEVKITPEIMQPGRRSVKLVYVDEDKLSETVHVLNEFEHIGILRAAGLEDVMIQVSSAKGPVWPPYDGGSRKLWDAVASELIPEGELAPWDAKRGTDVTAPEYPVRSVSYEPTSNRSLRMHCYIRYPGYDAYETKFEYPLQDIRLLTYTRTLGWPRSAWWLSKTVTAANPLLRLAGRHWPHHDKILWPQEIESRRLMAEVARHRLADALGVLAFIPPRGHYLCGTFHTTRAGHKLDVELAQWLYVRDIATQLRAQVA